MRLPACRRVLLGGFPCFVAPLCLLCFLGSAFAETHPSSDAARLAKQAANVLKTHCYDCHGDGGSDEGGFNYTLNLQRLVATRKVIPGKPDASPLMKRILKGEMPPEDITDRPSDAELNTLRQWIRAGAPSASVEKPREFISDERVYRAIADDLNAARLRDRRFRRYFSITHLYNAGLSDGELDTVRLALAKLINSLSWERDLVHPHAVDARATVYRIDIRSVRWGSRTWDRLVGESPYAFEPAHDFFKTCAELTECGQPLLRADWFIAAASRPPLYHAILEMPETLGGLERQLRIKMKQNIEQDRAARAGFTRSGVSSNPRIIERHRTSDGSCWISHDFAGGAGRANFFRHPLSFQPDGGEVIFSLPNGLQAYLLVKADGTRLDTAPTEIVKDTEQPGGAVVNGVSCMRCHSAGIIPKRDEVRESVVKNADAFQDQIESVKALYREADEFQELVDADSLRFQKALKQLGITRFSAKGEPVFNTSRRFQETLGLRQAGAELLVPVEDLLSALKTSSVLKRSLGVLRVDGGTISRDAFTEAFGTAMGELHKGASLAKSRFSPMVGGAIAGDLPAPADYRTEVALSEPFAEVRTGAAGRYLFFQLPKAKRLAVFDVAARKIVQSLAVPEGIKFAACRDYLMIARPDQRLLERWSLKDFRRDKVMPIPNSAPLQTMLMGSNSTGPLLLWSGGPGTLIDVEAMQPMNVAGTVIGGENRWKFKLRVSADGQCFTAWHNDIGPTPFHVMRLRAGKAVGSKLGGFSHNERWSHPSADGRLIFTSFGKSYTPDLTEVGKTWPEHTVLLPCVDPRFFLAIQGRDGKSRASVCTTCDQRIVHTVEHIEPMLTSSLPGRWANYEGASRVRFVPWLNSLVTLPDRQRVVVRHLNLLSELAETKEDYLFVVSLPDTQATARKTYRYKIDARSKRGGLKFELASGPTGMNVSPGGEVLWPVPAGDVGKTISAAVAISDSGNQELFHSFKVKVGE